MSESSDSTRRLVVRTAKELLFDAGQIPSSVEQMEVAIHYRRSLTDEEYARLAPSWCSIKAVHEGGHGIVLEQNT